MRHARRAGVLDRDSRRAEPLGVGPAFVAQHVELCRDHLGGRQPCQVPGEKRRGVGVLPVSRIGQVLRGEQLHRARVEHVPFPEQPVRLGIEGGHVRPRVDEHLGGDRRSSAVARSKAQHGRDGPARAVASHGDVGCDPPDRGSFARCPLEHGIGILDGRGEGVLGGEAVVRRDHEPARRAGEVPAHVLVGLDAPLDEAPAVEEQQDRTGTAAVGGVDPDRDVHAPRGDRCVADRWKRQQPAPECARRAGHCLPHLDHAAGLRSLRPAGEAERDGDHPIELSLRPSAQELDRQGKRGGQHRDGADHDQRGPHHRPPVPAATAPRARELSLLVTESLRDTSTMGAFAPMTMPASSAFA